MSDKPTLESLQADIRSLRRDLINTRSATTFWMLQSFRLHGGQHPEAIAEWIRSRIQQMKGWQPDERSGLSQAAADRALLDIMPELEAMGQTIASDLPAIGHEMKDGEANATPRPLVDLLETLFLRGEAQQWWLGQAFWLMSSDQPGMMARMIRHKLRLLKTEPPEGPAHVSSAELDDEMLRQLPGIFEVGGELVEMLETAQAAIDRKRAAAS